MKEKYLNAELEIIYLDASDVISTSNQNEEVKGDWDSNGWT